VDSLWLPLWLLQCGSTSHNIDNLGQIYSCTTLYRACIYSRIAYHRLRKMKHRSRTELTSNILEAANGGATKTKIMYKAFLSYAQLKEYLVMLIQNDLVVQDIEGIYRTTSKGIRFLETSRQLGGLLVPSSQQK
jgi:predicted transcriptional regulator